MRKIFAKYLMEYMRENNNAYFLTADLGYGLFDSIRNSFPERSFNVMSSEQLMIGMAVGLALEKKIPICYSITPFILYRPFEFIRNYLHHEKIPVKLVGGGRDKDYGYLGNTHWACDDVKIYSCLDNIKLFKPIDDTQLISNLPEFFNNNRPSYLNLKK